jgi:hypothetical protein
VPISVGSVEVDILPSTRGIEGRLRRALVPAATRAGEEAGKAAGRAFGPAMAAGIDNTALAAVGVRIGQQIATQITTQIRTSIREGISQGGAAARPAATRQGDETAGAFARAMRARLTEAFRSMPRLDIGLDDRGVDAELARLRARLETLSNKRIGIDVDVTAADAEVADIAERLRRLGATHPNVAVRTDTAQARAALEAIREEIARVTARPGEIRLETDGSFGARLRASVQAAEAALPNINIRADTDQAQAELASLRAQLTSLRDQRVGIDIDADTARARIEEIRTRLVALGTQSPNIAVRVDAAAAAAQLAQIQAMADALDRDTVHLRVDASPALSAIFQVSVAIAALATSPVLQILTAGTGAFIAGFSAAGVGVAAFAAAAIPALTGVKAALDAQKQAQDAATTATAKSGQVAAQAAAQAAQRSIQMAGAQAALATAERNGARQIAQAEQAVRDAVAQSAQQQAQAAQQVIQARRALADASEQAALREQQALRTVDEAERAVTQAQQRATAAQDALTQARKTAQQQLQDLASQYANAQLGQRGAQLQLQEAAENLKKTLADPKASKLQRDEAQLAYDQAKQQLADQTVSTQRLKDQQEAASKAGVAGSDIVKQAQDQLSQAQQDLADKTQALTDVRDEAARTEVANARAISDAQAKLADAQRNVAQVQAQGARAVADAQARVVEAQQAAADSIASAQRQIQSANLQTAGSTDQAAVAADKYRAALARLTPSGRALFNAWVALRSAFKSWSAELQPKVLPIFVRAVNGVKNSLPGLTPIVLGAARGIHTLQDDVSRGFKTPWWKELKKDFSTSVEPAIVGVGRALGNVFIGAAGIVDAFLPHIDSVDRRMDGVTGRFANFGRRLKGNPAFERFLQYSADQAPRIAQFLGAILTAITSIGRATAPLAGPVLATVSALALGIAAVARDSPGLIQLLYAAFLIAKLATVAQLAWNAALAAYRLGVILVTLVTEGWTAAQLAADAAFAANPIVVVIGAIILAIGLLVAAVLWAWNHWAWFRTSVTAVWRAVQTAAVAFVVWTQLKFIPFFTRTLPAVFTGLLTWVRGHWPLILTLLAGPIGLAVLAIVRHWDDIEGAFSNSWSWLRKNVLNPMGGFFTKTIPGWAGSMRDHVVKAWDDTAAGVSKTWGKIEDAAKKPVNFIVDTVWNHGIVGIWGKVSGWIPGLPKLGKLPMLAAGGTLPVQPGRFNAPTAIVGEGNPRHPEYVIPTDPRYRSRALTLLGEAGAQMLAGGGIIGTVTSDLTGAAKTVGGAVASGVSTATDFLLDPVGNLMKLLDPIMGKLTRYDDTAWGQLATALPKSAVEGLKKLVLGSGGSWNGGPIPSGLRATIITQALTADRVPPPGTLAQWLAGMNTLITRESGWNPNAINNWDSNARAGHPSQGLTQTIPDTWAAYVPASLRARGILDPIGNVAASIRYIIARYGNITNVQQANTALPPKGYDSGGLLQPGMNLAYNGTGRPEPVLTSGQWQTITSAAGEPRTLTVPVYYNAPLPENPQKVAMELGRRIERAVVV